MPGRTAVFSPERIESHASILDCEDLLAGGPDKPFNRVYSRPKTGREVTEGVGNLGGV